MTEKRFSIRLADGSEQTFDSASQLASWTQSQRALQKVQYSTKRFKRRDQKRRRPNQPRKSQNTGGADRPDSTNCGLPLARYNRHQSSIDGGSE